RVLRSQRGAILFLQNQREIGVGLLEKLLKLDHAAAEKFYGIYRDQYNPDLTAPDSVVEEWIAVGTFLWREKCRRQSILRPLSRVQLGRDYIDRDRCRRIFPPRHGRASGTFQVIQRQSRVDFAKTGWHRVGCAGPERFHLVLSQFFDG